MKIALKLILTTFLAVLFFSEISFATAIDLIPTSTSIEIGGSIDVNIIISGLENENLADFSLDLNYDLAVLSFTGYTLGTELTDSIMGQDDWSTGDLGGGVINLSELSWLTDFSLQSDSFILATVSFDGIAIGSSALTISSLILGSDLYQPIVASINSGSIDVSASVPEPTTILLFGIGLLGFASISRKR